MSWPLLLAWSLAWLLVGGCDGSRESSDPQKAASRSIHLLADPDPDVRRTAAISLGRMAASGSSTPLLAAVGDPDPRVRQWVAWALGQVGHESPSEVGIALVGMLEDPSPSVSMVAAQALAELDEIPSVTDLVVNQVVSGEKGSQAAAYALIGRMHFDTTTGLRQALRHSNPATRQALVAMLGETGENRVIPLLSERLREDGDANVRVETAYRLGMIGSLEVLATLLKASTDDRDENVRRWAAWAVQAIRSAGAPGSGPPPN